MEEPARAMALTKVTTIEGRAVLMPDSGTVSLRGAEGVDWACPDCSTVVAETTPIDRVWDLVVQCQECGTYSEFPRLPAGASAVGYVFFPVGHYRLSSSVEIKTAVLIIGVGAITGGGVTFRPEMN